MLTMARLVSHILFAVLIGSLYFNIGNEAKDVYNNAAQLFFALMFVLFGALMPTILTCECLLPTILSPVSVFCPPFSHL